MYHLIPARREDFRLIYKKRQKELIDGGFGMVP